MRRLIVLLSLLASTSASAQVLNPLTRSGIGGIPECKNSRVFCVGKQTGSEYTVISGSTCTSATSTPAAGSAMKAAKDSGLCTAATPCEIRVGPGVYNECVTIDNVSGINLTGAGPDITTLRPTVDDPTDVVGGVIRIGTLTTTALTTTDIAISGFTIWNDGWVSSAALESEQAVDINNQGVSNANPPATRIYVTGNRIVGNHVGVRIRGVIGAAPPATVSPAEIVIKDNEIISGGYGILHRSGRSRLHVLNNTVLMQSNAGETTTVADLAELTGTVQSGATAEIIPLGSSAPATNKVLAGRPIVFSGASCNVTEVNGSEVYIESYDGSTKTATIVATPNLVTAPNTSCTWHIPPVPNSGATGSRRTGPYPIGTVDWSAIRNDGDISSTMSMAGIAIKTTAGAVTAGDTYEVIGNNVTVEFNDFGHVFDVCIDVLNNHVGSGLLGIAAVPANIMGELTIKDNNILLKLNADYPYLVTDPAALNPMGPCPIAGIFIGNSIGANRTFVRTPQISGSVTIENWGDPDLAFHCAVISLDGTAGQATEWEDVECHVENHMTTSSSTATAGAANTVTLNGSEPTTVDFYAYTDIRMTSGACSGQIRNIVDYTSGRVATVAPAWASCTPANGDGYTVGYLGLWDKDTGTFISDKLHLWEEGTAATEIQRFEANELIRTSGSFSGWSEECMEIENGGGTAYTDRPLPWTDATVGIRVQYAACRCSGTCGAAESVLLEDEANNQIGAANIACVDNAAALSWTDVRTDADGTIPAGTPARATNGTLSGTAGDEVLVCLRYTTTRFAP